METIVFVINYWFTLHRALRSLYQQAQIFSSNIWGISDQDVTLMQTPQHLLYELMQLILTSLQSFHVITIDFILILLLSSEEFDSVMLITDKFSKTVILISEQKTMTAKNWALELLNCLALLNWGLSQTILSDQDRKFTAELWKGLFKQLSVDLMFLTAYHPQTDESSEAINQFVEIALRH